MSKKLKSPTQLDLVRHGEHTLGSAICGVTDPPLTEKGWQQLQTRLAQLTDTGQTWDAIVTSPRRRCVDFAREAADKLQLACDVLPAIAEVNFGEWEGLDYPTIEMRYPGHWQAWINDTQSTDTPTHGGEHYGVFAQRIGKALTDLVTTYQGSHVLVLSHGGVIRAMMTRVLAMDPGGAMNIGVPHACHTRIVAYHHDEHPDWLQLEGHNMHPSPTTS